MAYPIGTLLQDGEFVFPATSHPDGWYSEDPVTLDVKEASTGGALANLGPGPGYFNVNVHPLWYRHPMTWGVAFDVSKLHYTSRDDSHIYGVTGYPSRGKIHDNAEIYTAYYDPNAYWTPAVLGDTPPPGADPTATVGQDPTTLDPPFYNPYGNKPYHYATLKIYDQMGVNRTGEDLIPDPDNEDEFLDPYDEANNPISFLYDDQDPINTNLSDFEWSPDGDNTRNQQVSLFAANTENKRGIRAIARNLNSWKEVGVYSDWDSVDGQNVVDASKQNVGGHAQNIVERYGRAPNFFKIYLLLEPAGGWPEYGETVWKPQPYRDFRLGDRVKVRMRQGYLDSGEIVARIMKMSIQQADPDNNVVVQLDCVPHMTDIEEIAVSYWPPD
jgi:hypothetical protein